MDDVASPLGKRLWSGLLDLLFPPRCIGCRGQGAWICPTCLAQVGRVEGLLCVRCGRSFLQGARCPSCRPEALPLDALRVPFFFEGVVQRAVHELKYRGRRVLAEPLGTFLADALGRSAWPVTPIVPVPLYAQRERSRGYNQAALLARSVAARTGWPLLEKGLVRHRNTPSQVGLERSARRENVRGAFCWEGPQAPPPAVLLLDDVCTTGATMKACAQALRDAGTVSVRGLALARPR